MGLEETDRYQSPEESCGRITASLRKDCDLIAPKPQPHLRTSEVGRFLRKRHVCGHGPPQKRIAAKTDRSEIVPYLGSSSGYNPGSLNKLNLACAPPSPHRAAAHAGRRVGGPGLHGASSVRRRLVGVARRSFPTSETHPTTSGSLSLTNHPQSSGRPDGS